MGYEKLSIKKISQLAGVSVATVSRVINQNGRYSKETEAKVRRIIQAYNYQPNQIARGLRTNSSKTIGIIIPDITNEFFSSIVKEVEMLLFKKDYTTFICNTNESDEIEDKYYWSLQAKGVDGLIYLSGKISQEDNLAGIPTVFIDRSIQSTKEQVVIESDNETGGYLATKELIQKNCRRIVLIRDQRQISTIEERFKGYQQALAEAGIPLDDQLILKVYPISYEEANRGMKNFMVKGVPFDGVFATTDWMALGAMDAIRQNNRTIPTDIQVVGYDNISISKFSSLPITTIAQNTGQMAKQAVELLLEMIEKGNEPEKKKYYIPVKLVKRETTK